MPYAHCRVPYALWKAARLLHDRMTYALCLQPYAFCLTRRVEEASMREVEGSACLMFCALCLMPYALCLIHTLTQRVEEASMREVEGSAHSRRRRQLEILAGRCV